jgi:hypothetical protein
VITINTIIIDAGAKTVEPLVIEIGSHKDNILDLTRHITGHNDPGIEGEYGKTPEVWFLCEDDPHRVKHRWRVFEIGALWLERRSSSHLMRKMIAISTVLFL